MKSKIIFVHEGSSWYLPFAIKNAAKYNSVNDIVHIGTEPFSNDIQFCSAESLFSDSSDSFLKNYVHKSSASEFFEKICFLRWFYIREYMRQEELDVIVHLDSDVLLFSSCQRLRELFFEKKYAAILTPKQEYKSYFWTASGHVSIWTYKAISDFCDYTLGLYQSEGLRLLDAKYRFHLNNGIGGGICDMTALYLFYRENSENIDNMLEVKSGSVLDVNIGMSDNLEEKEYLFDEWKNIKQLLFKEEAPYLYSNSLKKLIKAEALHLQGDSKCYFPIFYKGDEKINLNSKIIFQNEKTKFLKRAKALKKAFLNKRTGIV